MNTFNQARKKLFLSLICCLSLSRGMISLAQNIVSVNNVTGTANINIPIYNVSIGDLSSPISLNYNASGLKVEDYDNSFGQGWRLIAASSITREVRGFPDDVEYQSHSSYSVIKGWLKSGNTAPQTIQSTSLLAKPITSPTCGDEITDANTIAANFSYTYDTEPDQFFVSAPGLSCSFIFDGSTSHNIQIMPYRDYKITYATDSYGRILSFTVLNEKGIKYTFDKTYFVDHSIDVFNPGSTTLIDPSTLEVFKRDFLMYRNKATVPGYPLGDPVRYNDQWMLTKMEDTRGNAIQYYYENYSLHNPQIDKQYSYKEVEIFKPDGSGGFTKKKLYGITTARVEFHLLTIKTTSLGPADLPLNTVVQFTWDTPPGGGTYDELALKTIVLPMEKKTYELLLTKKFHGSNAVWYGYGRYFLKGIKSYKSNNLCDNVNTQFDFTYYNVNEANNTCYCTPINGAQTVDTILNAQDYWGYFNNKYTNTDLDPYIYVYPDNSSVEVFKLNEIPGYSGTHTYIPAGSDRTVNSHVIDGSLKSITYPNGAYTELEYENNEFYDNDVSGNVPGGGIRIKKITNNDGLNNNDITYYGYNDLTYTTLTTGRAISVPKFTMAFPNSTSYSTIFDKVKNSTYRTKYDLNPESKEILYGKVTVTKTSNGKTVYEYNTTGTFRSSSVTDWDESMDYIARTNLSSPTPCTAIAPSFLISGKLQYPFASDANFDFERGLLNKVTSYNEAGSVVATEEYTYDRSHTSPTKVYGLKLDEIGNNMAAYGQYPINTVVDNFLVTKVSKVFNSTSPTSTVYSRDEENYVYTSKSSSSPYRLLKEINKPTNESSISMATRFKYAKEYSATSTTGDAMNEALYYFNNNNINTVVETTQWRVDTSSSTEKTLGGSVNTFKAVTVGDPSNTHITSYLPYRSYQFISQAGVTGFTASTITSNAFVKDNTYYVNTPVSIDAYNANGIPQLVTDNSRIPKTIITALDRELKIGEFTNAAPPNIGFSDFDFESAGNFTIGSGSSITTPGRYSVGCLNFQPGTYLCKLITQSATSPKVVVSFWLKDASSSGNIYLCYTKLGCTGSICSTNSIASFTTGSTWKYYQAIIPWPSSTNTTFTFYLSTSSAVKMDDLMVYPDNAGVTAYSYSSNSIATNLLTAKTGVNGIGNTYEYDNAGRLWLTRDQFGNIIEMKKYRLPNRHIQQLPAFGVGWSPLHPIVNTSVGFTATLPASYDFGDCVAPLIVYKWNFGDGSSEVTTTADQYGNSTQSHTYTSTGKYQVTVTASSPGMTDKVVQTPATSSTTPAPLEVTSSSVSCTGGGTPVICAAGIIEYTSTGTCNLSYCSPMSAVCNNTNFKVTGITGGSINDVYSVQWEVAPEGTSDWSVWQAEATGAYQTSHSFHIVHTTSYQMRAKIRFCSDTGSTAYSNTIHVLNNF